jgi:bifunctional DNA-binding transcriptional regulator/antitoxin component of YhaV-PrlF toxin-antitoxin module
MKEYAEESKKLLLTGTYTYTLTLPKEWVKHLGWRAKQMLTLELRKDGIFIKDFPNKPRSKK